MRDGLGRGGVRRGGGGMRGGGFVMGEGGVGWERYLRGVLAVDGRKSGVDVVVHHGPCGTEGMVELKAIFAF